MTIRMKQRSIHNNPQGQNGHLKKTKHSNKNESKMECRKSNAPKISTDVITILPPKTNTIFFNFQQQNKHFST